MSYAILHDDDPMPYGKYQGKKMKDIPPWYLIWLYENKRASDNVARYVIENKKKLIIN